MGARTSQRLRAVVFAALVSVCGRAPAQDFSYFREEAPENLFAFSIGDAEVDFFASGSWRTGLAGIFGVAFHPPIGPEASTTTLGYPIPGFDSPVLFNEANIALTVFLMNSFFVDAAFLEPLTLSSLVGGYVGADEDLVRYLALGYGNFAFGTAGGPFGYIPVGPTASPGPGLEAYLVTEPWEHEFLLRYEESQVVVRRFRGTDEVVESLIPVASYDRGVSFVLPDTDVTDLRLFVQADTGQAARDSDGNLTGERFRELDLAREAVVSRAAGTILLPERPAGVVAVSYRVGPFFVGEDPTAGRNAVFGLTDGAPDPAKPVDFSFSPTDNPAFAALLAQVDQEPRDLRRSIDGATALVLYRPGTYSPFESLGRYAPPVDLASGASLGLRYRGPAGTDPAAPTLTASADGSRIVASAGSSPRDALARYPFLAPTESFPGGHPGLYRTTGPDPVPLDIVVSSRVPGDELMIGTDALPGTVEVFRDGLRDAAAVYDPETGVVILPTTPEPTERIEVRYRSSTGGGGDLVFAAGTSRPIEDLGALSLGTGLRWRLDPASVAEDPEERRGAVFIGTAVEATGDAWAGEAELSFAFSHPNTTGLLRVAGMDGTGRSPTLRPSALRPAAPPADPPGGMDVALRRPALYRNFAVGSAYLDYAATVEGSLPSVASGAVGPYLASAAAEIGSRVWVIEYRLDSPGAWSASTLALAPGEEAPSAIEFEWRLAEGRSDSPVAGNVQVYLDMGAVGEDIDGDGELDAEESPEAGGYRVSLAGENLLVPGEIDVLDSEDMDGNGYLDSEATFSLLRRSLGSPPAGAFSRVRIELSREERSRLQGAGFRGLRLTVVASDGGTATGRLLVGEIRFEGSPFRAIVPDGSVLRSSEARASALGLSDLPSGEDYSRLAAESGDGVLVVDFSALGAGDRQTLIRDIPTFRRGDYERLSLFVYPQASDPATRLVLYLGDAPPDAPPGEAFIREIVMPQAGTWHRIDLDLDTDRVFVDGVEVASEVPATFAGRAGTDWAAPGPDRQMAAVALGFGGSAGGRILVDEIHLAGARGTGRLDLSGRGEIAYPETILGAGGFPLLAEPKVRLGGTSGLALDGSLPTASALVLGELVILGIRSGIDVRLTTREGLTGLGHSFLAPSLPSPVTVESRFFRRYSQPAGYSSSLRTSLVLPGALSLALSAQSEQEATTALANWTGELALAAESPLSGALRANLSEQVLRSFVVGETYGTSWLASFPDFFLGVTGTEEVRGIEVEIESQIEVAPLVLGSVLGARTDAGPPGLRTGGSLRLHAAVSPPETGMNLSLSYEREHELFREDPGGPDFLSDMNAWGADLQSLDFLTAPFPGIDLFAPELVAGFADDTADRPFALFSAGGEVSLTRRLGTTPWDVLVPGFASLAFTRELSRNQESVAQEDVLDLALAAVGVNLFGSIGQVPVFDFYETDEISNRLRLGLALGPGPAPAVREATIGLRTELAIEGELAAPGLAGYEASVTNDLEITPLSSSASNELSAGFSWQVRPEILFGIEETRSLFADDGAYLEHEESLRFNIDSFPVEEERSLTMLVLGHRTAFVVPRRGELSLSGELALGGRPLILEGVRDMLTIVGFQVKLTGELTF